MKRKGKVQFYFLFMEEETHYLSLKQKYEHTHADIVVAWAGNSQIRFNRNDANYIN